MKILNDHFDENEYKDSMNQSIDFEDVQAAFGTADTNYYNSKIPLWVELQKPLNEAGISPKTIRESGILVEDKGITSAILGEAIEYFCRSFYNFYAQDKLIEYCYTTWSGVTNYYSSFFGLHSLLRLQGRAITSIWRGGTKFYIFPHDISKHIYVISKRGVAKKTAHEAAWFLFYEVYDTFSYPKNSYFESIFKKKNVGTWEEEIDFRNQINYEPYRGYEELHDMTTLQKILENYECKKFTTNDIQILSGLTTDPDYRYYARSALRIIFAYSLLQDFSEKNEFLQGLLNKKRGGLAEFLKKASPRKNKDMICCRLAELLNLGD